MTPHLEAKPGDYADIVLLPGDPLRAQWLAETYLDDLVCVNRVRNMLGFTGTYCGRRISVQGTGMGQPSLAIYCHELITVYGVRDLIRVGSCGAIGRDLKLNDLIIALTASTDSAVNRRKFGGFDFAPCASWPLVQAAMREVEGRGLEVHVGGIFSGDRFYTDDPDYYSDLSAHGVLAVEMESNALYTLASGLGARALTLLGVSDVVGTDQEMTAQMRQSGLAELAQLALETVVGLGDGA